MGISTEVDTVNSRATFGHPLREHISVSGPTCCFVAVTKLTLQLVSHVLGPNRYRTSNIHETGQFFGRSTVPEGSGLASQTVPPPFACAASLMSYVRSWAKIKLSCVLLDRLTSHL